MAQKRPRTRMAPGSGVAVGLALGVAIGVAMDKLAVGIAIGLALGAGMEPWSRGTPPPDGDDGDRSEAGGIDRGLLWLLVGLAVMGAIVLATAPELLAADPGQLGQLLVLVLAAGVPGVAIVGVLAFRRRHDVEDEEY